MTNRENYLSLVKRKGFCKMPYDFNMSPIFESNLKKYMEETGFSYSFDAYDFDNGLHAIPVDLEIYRKFYPYELKEGAEFTIYGVAHEPGEGCFHMTRMRHPMAEFDSLEQILSYPFPEFNQNPVINKKSDDYVNVGNMACTVWEMAWYLRSMENLFVDMMTEDPIAEAIFDKVTEISVRNAVSHVNAGADILFVGDDIGMQRTVMMSEELYCTWIKPRIKKVIDEARKVNPDIVVFYHSCGFVTPFIPHLIDVGVDVLNPVQPECMDFSEIHAEFGDKMSFHGTLGTQSLIPFGTPEDIKKEVFKNLDIASSKGGLLVSPTHMIEPEVPVENIVAYIEACNEYCR